MRPLITIIIPTYNRQELICAALKSIEVQTLLNWECIIIDDGSTDSTKEAIRSKILKDSRFRYFKRPEYLKKGPSCCRNFGLYQAKGKYIQFFDDDDVMYIEMLEKKLEVIERTRSDVVVSPLNFYNIEKEEIEMQNVVFSDDLTKDYLLGKISWYVSGPLWKRSFLSEAFDEELQTLDDWDFNMRNIYKNPRIAYIKEPLQIYFRYGKEKTLSTSRISRGQNQILSAFKAYRKHYEILSSKSILSRELKQCLMNRFTFLLREALLNKESVADQIYLYIFQKHSFRDIASITEITFGYFSYKISGKGYRFIKYG